MPGSIKYKLVELIIAKDLVGLELLRKEYLASNSYNSWSRLLKKASLIAQAKAYELASF